MKQSFAWMLLLLSGATAFSLHLLSKRVRAPNRASTRLFLSNPSNRYDLYQILQVSKKANDKEIKEGYRKLAKLYHPDANSNDNASIKFQEISRAYQILMDPQSRQKYDHELQLLEPGQHHLSITLEIDYEMSINGGEKWVHMRHVGMCDTCGGSGRIRGDAETCYACRGQGMCQQTKRMTVTIPPGVQNRDKLCVPGQGVDGTPPGNLYVSLIVWDKESVDGPDMWSSYETISYVDAVVGTGSSINRQSYWPTGYSE